jgi:hypothetical protein
MAGHMLIYREPGHRNVFRVTTVYLALALSYFTGLLILSPTPAAASPVHVIECNVTTPQGHLPSDQLERNFTFRRHWIQSDPVEELDNSIWSQGKFSSGTFVVDIYLIDGRTLTERGTNLQMTLLDGHNGFRDELIDEALATGQRVHLSEFTIEAFGFSLRDKSGTALDSHLIFPENINLESFPGNFPGDQTCWVVWNDHQGGAPCTINGVTSFCEFGTSFGFITSVASEDHDQDHGSIDTFTINAGLNDAWVSADAAFQGMFITVFPVLKLMFAAWFTFDSVPPDGSAMAMFGSPDQRWVTALGYYDGNRAELKAELTTGGRFNASNPLPSQDTEYGTITMEFVNCEKGSVEFDFPSAGEEGSFNIQRVVDSNVALCEALNSE